MKTTFLILICALGIGACVEGQRTSSPRPLIKPVTTECIESGQLETILTPAAIADALADTVIIATDTSGKRWIYGNYKGGNLPCMECPGAEIITAFETAVTQ